MFDRIMNDRETGCFGTIITIIVMAIIYYISEFLFAVLIMLGISAAIWSIFNKKETVQQIQSETKTQKAEEKVDETKTATAKTVTITNVQPTATIPPVISMLIIAVVIVIVAVLFWSSRLGSALEFSARSSTNAAANGVWASAITKAQTADIFYRTGKIGYATPCYRCSTEALAQSRIDGSLEKPVFLRPGAGFEDVLPEKPGNWQLIEINGKGMLPVHPALPQGGYDQSKIWFVDPEILEPTRDNGDSPLENTAPPPMVRPAPTAPIATGKSAKTATSHAHKRKTCHCRDDGNYIFKFN